MSIEKIAVADLTEQQAKAELARLVVELKLADAAYYQEDAPHLTDADYDALRLRNLEIEARFPKLKRTVRLPLMGLARPNISCRCSHWAMLLMMKMPPISLIKFAGFWA